MTVCIIYMYVKEHINQYKIECPKKKGNRARRLVLAIIKDYFLELKSISLQMKRAYFMKKELKNTLTLSYTYNTANFQISKRRRKCKMYLEIQNYSSIKGPKKWSVIRLPINNTGNEYNEDTYKILRKLDFHITDINAQTSYLNKDSFQTCKNSGRLLF